MDMQQSPVLQMIFDNLPFLVWLKDNGGVYLEVNQAFVAYCGKSKREIVGKTAEELFSRDVAAAYQQIEQAAINEKKEQHLDHVYQVDEEGCSWFVTYVKPLLDIWGNVEGTMGFSRKITKRKALEEELKNQQRFLKTLFDTVPDFFVYKDKQGRVLGCNPACLQNLYGAETEGDVIGKTAAEILHDENLAQSCLRQDRAVLHHGKPLKSEENYILVDGTVLEVETVKTPYFDNDGAVAGLISLSRDITDRKKLEKNLKRYEEETRRELALAARVQMDSLPKPVTVKNVRVETLFLPYRVVSGDMFNYKWFPGEEKLAGYLVDMSGHGVATALQTAKIKILLDAVLLDGTKVGEKHFQFINTTMMKYLYGEAFAGLLYFEFDFRAAELKVVAGGITLFLAANPQACSWIPSHSGFLGMFDKADICSMTLPLKAGDIYCIMSDGLSDLVEQRGLRRQNGLSGYVFWLERLMDELERSDDCSAVFIEVVQVRAEMQVSFKQNEAEVAEVRLLISEFLAEHASDCSVRLEVAVNEAVNNSLFSGGKWVCVRIRRRGRVLSARITDDGPGFDVSRMNREAELADNKREEAELSEHGRGIDIMRMFCDSLIYNAKGNDVLLVKKCKQAKLTVNS